MASDSTTTGACDGSVGAVDAPAPELPLAASLPVTGRCRSEILRAFAAQPPREALRRIAEVWRELDLLRDLAEARTRILVRQTDPPPLALAPAWFEAEAECLSRDDEDLARSHPLAVEAAQRLVCAALAQHPERELTAELGKAPLGQAEIVWRVAPQRLVWTVRAAELPWPGCDVHVYRRLGTAFDAPASSRRFHDAFGVLEDLREFLHAAERDGA